MINFLRPELTSQILFITPLQLMTLFHFDEHFHFIDPKVRLHKIVCYPKCETNFCSVIGYYVKRLYVHFFIEINLPAVMYL